MAGDAVLPTHAQMKEGRKAQHCFQEQEEARSSTMVPFPPGEGTSVFPGSCGLAQLERACPMALLVASAPHSYDGLERGAITVSEGRTSVRGFREA